MAKDNMEKAAEWNKQGYDRKAKAVDVEVGDKVLMQNCRKKGGTGKLKSYWEHSIFEVVEKRGDAPVYKIRNVHKKKDERVVHRNLLMLCNELPVDVFKEPSEVKKAKSKNKKVEKKSCKEAESEESSEDEFDRIVVMPMGSSLSFGGEGDGLSVERTEVEVRPHTEETQNLSADIGDAARDDTGAEEPLTQIEEASEQETSFASSSGPVDEDHGESEVHVEDDQPDEEEESEESDDDDQQIIRRSARQRRAAKRLVEEM